MHLTVLLDLFTDRHDRFLNLSYIFWRVKMYRKLMVREIIELLFCLFAFPFSSCWHTCLYCCCSCCLSCNSMCCCSLRISSSCWSWVLCKISANWSRSISNWRMEADSESTYKSNSTKFHFSNACKGILLACIQTPPPPPFPQEKKNRFFLRGGKGVLYRGYILRAESPFDLVLSEEGKGGSAWIAPSL